MGTTYDIHAYTHTHLNLIYIDIYVLYIVLRNNDNNEEDDMSTEHRKERNRQKQQRRRDRQREVGLPPNYTEDSDRMISMQTRLDIRRLASICAYLEERHGTRPKDRSDLIRSALDLLYVSIVESEHFKRFDLHREAYDYLGDRDLVPSLDSRDGQRFDRLVLASESYDMEHRGMLETSEREKFEGIEVIISRMGLDPTDERVGNACRAEGVSHEKFVEWYQGRSFMPTNNAGSTPDDSPIVDEEYLRKRALGGGKKSAGDEIATPDFIRRKDNDEPSDK